MKACEITDTRNESLQNNRKRNVAELSNVCTRDDQNLRGLSSLLNNGLDKRIQISSNDTLT